MWLVLQLADSAFPTGGYVHSGGLEAMAQAGPVELPVFCRAALAQAALGSLPLAGAAWDAPEALAEIDAFASATLWSHVATRASTAQGWALLDVADRAFGDFAEARARVARGELAGHFAPVFGFVTRTLGVARDEALTALLHVTLRGVLSAAVRLGLVGPGEAQGLHRTLHADLAAALATGRALGMRDVAQPAPLVELVQARHDHLYSRLFRS